MQTFFEQIFISRMALTMSISKNNFYRYNNIKSFSNFSYYIVIISFLRVDVPIHLKHIFLGFILKKSKK
jgi:hypothetical protein